MSSRKKLLEVVVMVGWLDWGTISSHKKKVAILTGECTYNYGVGGHKDPYDNYSCSFIAVLVI